MDTTNYLDKVVGGFLWLPHMYLHTHTHTQHINIYVYKYICVCVCKYVYAIHMCTADDCYDFG